MGESESTGFELMPILESTYKAPYYLFSKHLQTILPALFRKVGNVVFERERIHTPDNDFLDLDWSRKNSKDLVIISHGLEGDSRRTYVLGMTKVMNFYGFDVLAWNYRGCSGEVNKLLRFYHSGETNDLDYVIRHAEKNYDRIFLIGFSIGGNITLKYLGEQGSSILPKIKASVTFSVPCHLTSGAKHLANWRSKVYMNRFMQSLKKKVREKSAVMPELLQAEPLTGINNFLQFDEVYTAPIHGFKSAAEYWEKSSSLYYLKNISIPTLIVTAKNDPMLTPQCFPVQEAKDSEYLFLEMPEEGGHCGFYENDEQGFYWSEKRAVEFIKSYS